MTTARPSPTESAALELLARLTPGPGPDESLAATRARYDADAGRVGGRPVRVRGVAEVSVAGVPCRRYEPLRRSRDMTVVYLHGGGWVLGSLATHDHLCRAFSSQVGVEVLSVGYRLAPEHPYPAALDDAEAVLGSVKGAVALAGDSSGANLAAGLAIRARDQGRQIVAQMLAYPPLDPMCSRAAFGLDRRWPPNRASMSRYWNDYLGDAFEGEVPPDAAPLLSDDLVGLAPALVLTAEWDPLKDDGADYSQRLAAAGVHVRHLQFPGMIHGFLRIPSSSGFRAGLDAINSFLDELGR